MAGIFGGYDIPDWMLFGQQPEQNRPNAMLGGTPTNGYAPGGLFNNMWQDVYGAAQNGQFTAGDPSMPLPEQLAPRQGFPGGIPSPQPPMYPGANQYAGQGPAMGYAPEEPRLQQPLAGGPPGPQYAQAGPPGFGDRLNAGAMGFFNARSPMEALGNLLGGATTGQRQDERGQTIEAQRAAIGAIAADDTIDMPLKRALIQSPQLAMDFVQSKIKKLGGSTQDIMEYEYARKQGFRGTLENFMKTVKQREVENFALQPTYVTDPKTGEVSIIQLGNRGNVSVPTIPGGGQVQTKNLIKVPSGDNWDFIDPVTKQVVKTVPRNVSELEAAQEQGKTAGKVAATLPAVEANTSRLLSRISNLENHKGLSTAVGIIAGRLPTEYVSAAASDFKERVAEIGSSVWTEGIKDMVGLGALSNAEGSRIEAARSRLKLAKSEEDFKTALQDVREITQQGLRNARLIAQGKMQPIKNEPAAPSGAVEYERGPDGKLRRKQ